MKVSHNVIDSINVIFDDISTTVINENDNEIVVGNNSDEEEALILKDEEGKDMDKSLYKNMIGTLLYLTSSRPNISYSVGVCAQFQANLKESHITAVKNIMKYINGKIDFGIWFTKDTNISLVGYTDTDWASCPKDRKKNIKRSLLPRKQCGLLVHQEAD